eukprot:1720011-Pyramimonas_sp.AAC.1
MELTFAAFPDLIAKRRPALLKCGQGDLDAEEPGGDFIDMLDAILAHDTQNCSETQSFRTAVKQQK